MTEDDLAMTNGGWTTRRTRVFVAGGARPPEPPTQASLPLTDNEDIPVLTEVVAALEPPPEAEIPQERIDARAAELLEIRMPLQRQALSDELAAWLDTELPQVVMHVVDGLTDQLVAKVTEAARAALLPRLQDALETDVIPIDDAV